MVRIISSVFPLTRPTTAGSAIGSKGLVLPYMECCSFILLVGLGLGDEPVYIGFITVLAWLLVIYLVSIAFFRTE